ncbi:hypothetical protein [Streptomyces sp. NBC_00344]|uniref:hypothetical protein n=1 Tax=Streptomyces sp. NBC_00344 TaxID=2975720 RepID=UPI002E1DBD3C
MPQFKALAHAHLGMRATAEPLGNSWLLGSNDLASSAQWVRLLGLIGSAITILAIGFSVLAELLRLGRDVTPLSVLTDGHRTYGIIAGWYVLFPSMLASAVGSFISVCLTAPISVGGRQPVPTSLYVVLASGATTCTLLLCLWGWRMANTAATRWRPTAD